MAKKVFCSTVVILLFNVIMLYAQTDPGEPCSGTDVDVMCPLDTWVFVLAFFALLFAAFHLRKKQKNAVLPLKR